jgi:hypothetical protein
LDHRSHRRAGTIAGLALAVGVLLIPLGAAAQSPTPSAEGHLVIADISASTIHVASLRDGAIVASLPDLTLADHAGFLPLPDGRVLFTTAGASPELVALELDGDAPTIVGRVALPAESIHLSVDPSITHAAVSSGTWNEGEQRLDDPAITMVDLDTWKAVTQPIESGEPGVIVTDDLVLHRNDDPARLEGWPTADILAGSGAMSGSVPIGAAGHGEAYSKALQQAFIATDDGIDVVDVSTSTPTFIKTFPWDAGDRSGGRAYDLRIATTGDSLVTYVTDRTATAWGDWTTDAYIADLTSDTVLRVPLGKGLVYRAGIGEGHALFFNQVPREDPEGDHAYLLDLDTASDTYGEITAAIPLPPLSQQGTAEVSIWEAGEGRIAAMTPDGSLGFVTNGGDGTVSVIDADGGAIVDTIDVPTSLSGGGYLVAVQPGMPLVDNIGK